MAVGGALCAPVDPTGRYNRTNHAWHAGSSFAPVTAKASVPSARMIPSNGGDPQQIRRRAVDRELPDRLKRAANGKVVIHDYAYSRSKVDPALVTEEERAAVPPVRQAMVIDHGPEFGPSLYLGSHAARIEGMSEAEGRALIDEQIGRAHV